MKVKVVCRKLYDYVRYDLKEIAFPSSLVDPPHIKKRRKLTWHERFLLFEKLKYASLKPVSKKMKYALKAKCHRRRSMP
ncbi:hypothetical protein V6Z11_D03G208600 [Gossypium hirsutum]